MHATETAAIATPIGLVLVEGDDALVARIRFASSGETRDASASAVREAAAQIAAWFAGRLAAFDLPLAPSATPRGEVLRQAIIAVGHGRTASYGDLARAIGSSGRAVGQACARNPLPLVVPCHRILRADGLLGSYSAGDGPRTKRWLLDFETAQPSSRPMPT